MPDAQGRPFARDIAERIGISTSDWRARVSRKHAPAAVDRVEFAGVLHSVWDPATVDAYVARRRVAGEARTPAAFRTIACPHEDCDSEARSWAELNDHIRNGHISEES